MSRKTQNKFVKRGEILEIQIRDYAFGGKGIGRISNEHGEFVVFVPNTLPGQSVKAQVKKVSKTYAECKLLEVTKSSEHEVEVPYQEIPGAPYIKLPVEKQHAYKKQSTFDLFKRIGKVADIESLFDEFIVSPRTFHYRNKMEYAFSAIGYDHDLKIDVDEFTLGFKKRGTWWCGDDLKRDSGLFDQEVEDKLKWIKDYCQQTGLPPWHGPKKAGFFRYFVVRKSFKTNRLLFNLVTTSDSLEKFDLHKFSDFLVTHFGDRVAGFLHTTNDETGDRTIATSGEVRLVYGKDKIVEELLGLSFEISVKSFFQTNPKSAERLYEKVAEYALERKETIDNTIVLDLFCGTGTIGQIVASKSENAQIVGVDIVESAI
ncbi:MAG: TRAM domain-containing protein, partial [Bacteroidota bacterium]